MRSHDALVPMPPEKLQQIFAEAEPDFSAQICKKATIGDLDHHAIETFRKRWHRRSGNDELLNISSEQLLLKHISDNQKAGSRFSELREVLPSLSRRQVQAHLAALKKQNKVWMVGKTSAAKWYPCDENSDFIKGQ